LSVAFALLKYNLFDIDAVFKVGLQVTLTGALLLIYVLVVALLSISFGIYDKDLLVPLFFSILVVLVFSPLLRWIEGVVSRYIYRREYDPLQLQNDISVLLRTVSRPEFIAGKYLNTIVERVGLETASLFCQPDGQGSEFVVSAHGGTYGISEFSPELWSPWIECFEARKNGISKDEVESAPAFRESRGKLLKIFEDLSLEILFPLIFEAKLLGLVAFGRKRTGRGYNADEFFLLTTLTDQLALSIKNGLLFQDQERAKERYRRLYDESEAMNRRLVDMDQRQKHFVANISHELRTPISTILGYSEVLLSPTFDGDTQGVLERIVNGGRDLSELMDSLLEFSRKEAGLNGSTLEEVNVQELFQTLETMAQRIIRRRPIRFTSRVDPSVEGMISDRKGLQQILMHLLTNALKFTERGEVGLDIEPYPEKSGEFVKISVSDTGIGISKADQEVIFEEFRQLDGSSTRQFGGTGVGLSLCRKLARSLGAVIEVESETGRGSTFAVILPLRRFTTEPAARIHAA
jgi:signal transduction histidine kinase